MRMPTPRRVSVIAAFLLVHGLVMLTNIRRVFATGGQEESPPSGLTRWIRGEDVFLF